MFPTALQRLRMSIKDGFGLAVEFATLGELLLEDSGQSAGRLIGEQSLRGTVAAVEPECASRVRAPSREPRRRRLAPEPPAQPCT
jgi:hypothetical protein